MRGKYVSYMWRMGGKRDIQHHDKREAMCYDKAGSLCILGILSNLSMGRKVVFMLGIEHLF